MELGKLALVVMAAFTGVALYINLVEHPARRFLLDGDMLLQWKNSYKRAVFMQASLAMAGAILGLIAAFGSGPALFLTGALFSISIWGVTFRWIMPVNRALLAVNPDAADAGTRLLLEKWNMLHAIRTGLGLLAVICFFVALP
jgi:uncharacterized membrane protein